MGKLSDSSPSTQRLYLQSDSSDWGKTGEGMGSPRRTLRYLGGYPRGIIWLPGSDCEARRRDVPPPLAWISHGLVATDWDLTTGNRLPRGAKTVG